MGDKNKALDILDSSREKLETRPNGKKSYGDIDINSGT